MRTTQRSARIDRKAVLGLLFLVLGILLPMGSVLWFMNEAMTAQRAAARQELTDAYRLQLRLIAEQITAYWQSRADLLAVAAAESPAQAFARLVTAGVADAVIVTDAEGAPAYPGRPSFALEAPGNGMYRVAALTRAQQLEREQPEAAQEAYLDIAEAVAIPSVAAQAAQGAIRTALRQGRVADAIGLIEKFFVDNDSAEGRDVSGRLIVADELLLLVELLPTADARRGAAADRLVTLLNDYAVDMAPAQRLFLMEAVSAAKPGPAESMFPTYRAERLAQAYLTTSSAIDPGAATLQATRQPDIWRLSFADGQGVALFATESVDGSVTDLLAASAGGVVFGFAPPGRNPGEEAIQAGPLLPGWQVGFTLGNAVFEAAEGARRVYYISVGALVVATIAVAGLLLLAAWRHQLRVAALKTDLVAAVSHELRTPLASMRLLVDTLLEHGTADERRTREYLDLIARENARLSRLIESFLEFSRLDRHKRQFEFELISPSSVIDAAAAAVHDRFEQAGCRLETSVAAGLPPIEADLDALCTVLVNLLDNALKYTNGQRQIALRALREGDQVVFAVQDNGIGIHARDRRRIFGRFHQVDRRLSRETGGVGLGLSIVDLIVRAHRGSVEVASEPGHGSTFSVHLPARAAA